MAKRFPIHPPHPERNCWGCDRYCAADALLCGNGSVRTPHPVESFGPDWAEWEPPPARDLARSPFQAQAEPGADPSAGAEQQAPAPRA